MEAGRAERMEALRLRMAQEAKDEEEREQAKEKPEVWGGHDEEVSIGQSPSPIKTSCDPIQPPAAIRTLMEHTAKSLLTSPNPQVLELRILTHHAGDARFSFLKGRYKDTWEAIKRGDKPKQPKLEESTSKGGLGGLMGDYGDSDSENSDEPEGNTEPPSPPPLPPPPSLLGDVEPSEANPDVAKTSPAGTEQNNLAGKDQEEQARALRREKARAWMAARKQAVNEAIPGSDVVNEKT